MNLNKIYIGYTHDYVEHLLEDKDGYFFDLIKKEAIFKNDVYQNLLFPFSVLDSHNQKRLLFSLKKLYLADRNQNIDMTRVFVGDVFQITEIFSKICGIGGKPRFKMSKIMPDALLYKESEGQYLEIMRNQRYELPLLSKKGTFYINEIEMISFNECLLRTNETLPKDSQFQVKSQQTKKKVLENYCHVFKKGVSV